MGVGSYTFMLLIATPLLTGNLKLLEPLFGEILNFILGFGHIPELFPLIGSLIVGVGIYYLNLGYEDKTIWESVADSLIELDDSKVVIVR